MLIVYLQAIINKKLNGQSKVVKASFTGNNITMYSYHPPQLIYINQVTKTGK